MPAGDVPAGVFLRLRMREKHGRGLDESIFDDYTVVETQKNVKRSEIL